MKFTLAEIPSGQAGTDATVQRIAELVNDALRRPSLRLLALQILDAAGVPNKNTKAAARALFDYVRRRIRYIQDPVDVETVQAPEITLKLQAGDCDDHSALLAALAASIGIPARFRVVGYQADRFLHIWPELNIKGQWTPADTTMVKSFGMRVQQFPAEKVYSLKGDSVMPISLGAETIEIPRDQLQTVVYKSVIDTLTGNWRTGRINEDDVNGYIRVIDEGNFPGRNTFAEAPARQAMVDFLADVKARGLVSMKPIGTLSGLEGLDGFLSSVWNGIKKAVGGVVKVAGGVVGGAIKAITGSSSSAQPTTVVVQQPAAGTTTTGTGTGVSDILSSPIFLLILGVVGGKLLFAKGR